MLMLRTLRTSDRTRPTTTSPHRSGGRNFPRVSNLRTGSRQRQSIRRSSCRWASVTESPTVLGHPSPVDRHFWSSANAGSSWVVRAISALRHGPGFLRTSSNAGRAMLMLWTLRTSDRTRPTTTSPHRSGGRNYLRVSDLPTGSRQRQSMRRSSRRWSSAMESPTVLGRPSPVDRHFWASANSSSSRVVRAISSRLPRQRRRPSRSRARPSVHPRVERAGGLPFPKHASTRVRSALRGARWDQIGTKSSPVAVVTSLQPKSSSVTSLRAPNITRSWLVTPSGSRWATSSNSAVVS